MGRVIALRPVPGASERTTLSELLAKRRIRLVHAAEDEGPATPAPVANRRPLGQILLERGALAPGDLIKALALRNREDVRLGDILLTHGWVREADLMAALAAQWNAAVVDLIAERPDPRLIDALGPELCLREAMVPWRRIGGVTLIATARPEAFASLRPYLPEELGPYRMVLAPERDVHSALLAGRQTALIRRAETKVDPEESCRNRNEARASRLTFGIIALSISGLVLAPHLVFALLMGWALITLIATSGLKFTAWIVEARAQRLADRNPKALPQGPAAPIRLPIVSIMVPLFRETDIAERLVARLGRLNYPRELLDILLVVEEDDATTRATLGAARLPRWMRTVTVPRGPIKTKPRALNYALNFCRGAIVGIYDAEDQPDPEQLHVVTRRFAEAPPEVACLQGILDYYNPRTNWLSRCFTVEYAAWFRAMLPGIARMGLVVPLGGTTLFFRRETIEELGGWDAHNVTEDADLGIRLARHGYRTELIPTVTHEEANCRALPWVKQRSRWIKGYAMTWAVHMRDPVRLWRELGPKRFIGLQILIFGSLSQYLLAPVMWSFWLVMLGLPHPIDALLTPMMHHAVLFLFISTELVNIAVGAWAVRGKQHRHLMKWVPTLHVYFPLGALAGWKAIYEVVTRPFYWDKTMHGVFDTLQHVVPGAQGSDLVPAIAAATAAAQVPAPRTALAPLID